MDKNQFDTVFSIISAALVNRIALFYNCSDQDAVMALYASKLYEYLEKEETKVWQYSTEKLFELYQEEKNTGKISFQDA